MGCTAYERLVARLLRVDLLAHTAQTSQAQQVLHSLVLEFGCGSWFTWDGNNVYLISTTDNLAVSNKCNNSSEQACTPCPWPLGKILVAAAGLAVRRGDTFGALRLLEKVPRSCESSAEAQLARGEIYKDLLGDDAAAVRCLRRALLQPHLPGATALRAGELLLELKYPRDASTAFEKAAALRPRDRSIVHRLGKGKAGPRASTDIKRWKQMLLLIPPHKHKQGSISILKGWGCLLTNSHLVGNGPAARAVQNDKDASGFYTQVIKPPTLGILLGVCGSPQSPSRTPF